MNKFMMTFNIFMAISLSVFVPFMTALEATTEADLTSLLQHQIIHQPEIFNQAVRIVDSLKHAPSCNRLAVATLIESCKSLESTDGANERDSYLVLDGVKSAFAARLAVCELMGAHATVPEQCWPLIPRNETTLEEGKRFRCFLPGSHCTAGGNGKAVSSARVYQQVSQRQVAHCLSALESKPQWWTSYSNARQNAISICHAARSEIEKGESF